MRRDPSASTRPARRRLRADRRGAVLVEFAIVAAPLIALILAALNFALVFFADQVLQTTAEKTARIIMTGQAQAAGMTQAQVKQVACANLPSFLSCGSLMMDVQNATQFSDVDTSVPTITFDKNGNVTNGWVYNTGGAGAIVILRLLYIWPVSTSPLGFGFGNLGARQRLLVATTVSKTEPY